MTGEERTRQIESYGNAYAQLVDALRQFPKEMWHFKPSPDRWSVHEIVVHIADSEANSYVRCRRFLAEPGESLMAYDESRWARELDYHAQSPEDALDLFRLLRKKSYDLIKIAPGEVWTRQCFHPENGVISMDKWLDTYERHVPEHVAQMEEVFSIWRTNMERAG